MAQNKKCDNCDKKGLPILPVRYSVMPKYVKAGMPAHITGDRMTSVTLTEHQYGLRTLREGWVYLYYEVGARGRQYWEAYRVTADGRLWKQQIALPPMSPVLPVAPTTDPACAQNQIAVQMDFIVIEQPEKCTGRVYIAFSELAWEVETFGKYRDNMLRGMRMQWIEPSKWINSANDQSGHVTTATSAAIDKVIEYMPGFDPKSLSPLDDKLRFSKSDGSYDEKLLKQEITRYPLAIRQASPGSTSQVLEKLMGQVAAAGQSGGANPPAPMMLALWDAVGAVHELNGFRNDPVSWMDRYASQPELGMQVMALHDIDAAKKIVYSREENDVNSQEAMAKQAHDMTALGSPGARASLAAQRTRALASADPAKAAQVNAYYDDMDWMAANNIPGSYQTRIIQLGQLSSAGSSTSTVPYTGSMRDGIMNDARAYAKGMPGYHDRDVKESQEYGWSWYENRLKRPEIEAFRKQYDALKQAVYNLQETRSDDVGAWLKAELLFATLEDYHTSDLADIHDNALDFEFVVNNAIEGLGSTPKGQAIVDDLVTRWDPTKSESIVWRAVAMNHPKARQELGTVLADAKANKAKALEAGGVNLVVTIASKAEALSNKYKAYASLAAEKDPKKISWYGAKLKAAGKDVLMTNIGDRVFDKFRINQVGDFVGEKILQTIFLQRAGISKEDALTIVEKQAVLEKRSRLEILERLGKAKTFLSKSVPGNTAATDELFKTWEKLKEAKDESALNELKTARIGAFITICELVNFWHLLAGADKDSTAYLQLTQSGLSLVSGIISVTMAPYYAVLKDSTRLVAWKSVGGFLSTVGAVVSTWLDVQSEQKARKYGQIDVAIVLIAKSGVDFLIGIAVVINAISTASPLIKGIAKQSGNKLLLMAAGAAEWAEVAAAGKLITAALSFEGVIAISVLQMLADHLLPDDLQNWCARCVFGNGKGALSYVSKGKVKQYKDMPEQEKEYDKALLKVLGA
ncbi:T6SS effector BTH_I2691 family protein [Burkholderia sp. Ax-1719]|uniref:T6SS effector BTH_I2691 family protein n=1 Tax=Burkholderia sp. Ax-1719 TaxID=2608334 RepID=UPI001F048C27|nr:T6SS effector BTH_I2691 family protein [Burkholderia sp. Ax-1719]